MYPHERSLVKQLSEFPFALVGVNSDPDLDEIRQIVEKEKLTWRSFWNGPDGTDGPISTAWNVQGWPTIFILDQNGVIRFKGHGGPEMDRTIEKLLNEMGHDVKISRGEH